MENKKQITQYFSKHEKCWVYFEDRFGNRYMPNQKEIEEHIKYKYQLR